MKGISKSKGYVEPLFRHSYSHMQVSFAYPSNLQQIVLENADFFFPAGETTWIVGKSGSGKSTLSNLILKYYEPLRGEVLVDGNSVQTLDSDWLRQNITLVQQQSVLFNETILKNIEFGRGEPVTRADVLAATKTADLDQTLNDLPDGINTVVGSNGKSLSGGQQQRIALARARLRDSPIVILDEATSALDQTSREKVAQTIREWRKGKTTIVITHDVTQILDDEYVYVLEHGLVVQEGYRNKLAKKEHGTFASFMPEAQLPDVYVNTPERRNSEPISPIDGFPPEYYDDRIPEEKDYISKILGVQPGNRASFAPGMGPHSGRALALGGGAAQAYALQADNLWSTPLPPGEDGSDGVFQPFTSSMLRRPSLKEFLSPKPPQRIKFEPMSQPLAQEEMPMPVPALPAKAAKSNRLSRSLAIDTGSSESSAPFEQIELTRLAQASIAEPPDEEDKKPASLKRVFGTIWPTLKWRDRSFLVLGFAAAFVVAGGTPAFAYVFAKLLQVYYQVGNRDAEALKWALSLLGIAIVDGLATFTAHYSLEHAGQAWVNSLRVEALKRIMAQPRSWFDLERNSPSRLNECLDRNAEEMRNLIGRFAGPIFTTFWMITISIIWSFVLAWKLTLVSLACAPVMYATTRLFNWTSAHWESKTNDASATASSIFTETFANIRVVRALTLESHFKKKHDVATSVTYQTGASRGTYSGLLFGLSDSMSYFVTALIFYYGTILIIHRERPLSAILEVVNLLTFGIANAVAMLNFVPQINTSRTTATHMLYLASLPLAPTAGGQKRLATPFPIVFDKLSFTYSTRPHIRTLDSVSLTFAAGTCTAIVGPSGSGKSTIASILLGLYAPDGSPRGQPPALTFGGIPVEECNVSSLRSYVSFVSQSSLLFPASVLANIIYGLPPGSPFANVHAAVMAAREAGIHDFIASLPHGYATQIGEGGMGLSGGQAQRVAIARALVRRPKILVMDEATSALDAVSADAIRETVKRLMDRGRESAEGGTAVVLISHGVDMMRIADEIVVVEHGKVVERGAFEALRTRGGPFSRLIGYTKVVEERRVLTPIKARTRESWAVGRKSSV